MTRKEYLALIAAATVAALSLVTVMSNNARSADDPARRPLVWRVVMSYSATLPTEYHELYRCTISRDRVESEIAKMGPIKGLEREWAPAVECVLGQEAG